MASVASASATQIPSSIRRDLLLCGLNKLEDKDTLKTAVDELHVIIQGLDAQGVSSLVSCLCRVERGQKNFARKECLRLFVSLASSMCPSRDVFLSPSVISKTTRFLIQSFQDPDTGVRETASRTLAMIAREWSLFHKQLIRGEESNVFMKRIFKALSDSKREVQIAASDALNEMSGWIGSLQKDLAKDCLRFLKSPDFVAKASLIQALGSVDAESAQPRGMIASNASTFQSLIFHLIGREENTQHTGHGLLHLLSSSDWFTRKAAVDCLRCLALLFAPELTNSKKKIIPKIKERLRRQRFDRVKPVRDIMQRTLDIYESLSDPASGIENNDLRFDLINDAESVRSCFTTPCGQQRDELTETEVDAISILNESKNDEEGTFAGDDASDIGNIAHSIPCTPKRKKSATGRNEGVEEHCLESKPRFRTDRKSVDRLKSSAKKKSKGASHPSLGKNQTCLVSHAPKGPAASLEKQLTEQQRSSSNNEDTQFNDIASNISHKIQELSHCIHEEVSGIKQSLDALQARVVNANSPTTKEWPEHATEKGVSFGGMEIDLDDLYASALPCELKLLRLMQRTAPVIPQLSLASLEALLEIFSSLIAERRSLTRILPWLWQLTESSCHHITASLSPDLHRSILKALTELSSDDIEQREQIEALQSALAKTFISADSDDCRHTSPTDQDYEQELNAEYF